MSQNGYQNFFKKAQDIKRDPNASPTVRARPRTDSETEAMLRQAVNGPVRRKRPPFPFKAVIGSVVCIGIGGLYLAFPDEVEKFADRIEIRAMGHARAADTPASEKPADKAAGEKSPAEKSTEGKKGSAKSAAPTAKTEGAKAGEGESAVAEDTSHFEKLRQRKEELDQREKELSELEEELQRQKAELDKRITALEDLRTQIAQILKDRVEMDQDKVNKLVDLYSNMKPKQAADVIGTLNEELAVEVLAKMKKKNAAEVMNLLPAEKARVLSEKYTGYRRRNPATPDNKG